jgi:hypothetical protein
MLIKRMIASFFLLSVIHTVVAQKTIVIKNTLAVNRVEEVVEVPWSEVIKAYPSIDTGNFKIINKNTKQELVFQLEYKGKAEIQNLLVQTTVPANGKIVLQIVKGKHKTFVAKTYCRFVPERKDDFAWENDRIAFRTYGKALEKFPNEMAYGVDVWVKRTTELVIDKRYKAGTYHVDNGDGLDYYHVGRTLGAGGIAPYLKNTIWYPANFREWKILDNGPLRSTFQLFYDEWTAAEKRMRVVKTTSLDAGSQMNKNEVIYDWDAEAPLTVAVGIIKRPEQGEMLLNEQRGVLAYWEPQHGKDGTTGVGCVFLNSAEQMMVTKEQLLAITKISKNKPFIYYNGAAWNKAGKFTNAGQWTAYLDHFRATVLHPLLIAVQ